MPCSSISEGSTATTSMNLEIGVVRIDAQHPHRLGVRVGEVNRPVCDGVLTLQVGRVQGMDQLSRAGESRSLPATPVRSTTPATAAATPVAITPVRIPERLVLSALRPGG